MQVSATTLSSFFQAENLKRWGMAEEIWCSRSDCSPRPLFRTTDSNPCHCSALSCLGWLQPWVRTLTVWLLKAPFCSTFSNEIIKEGSGVFREVEIRLVCAGAVGVRRRLGSCPGGLGATALSASCQHSGYTPCSGDRSSACWVHPVLGTGAAHLAKR